jgi:DNA-directed RNA polymerase subunit A'
MAMEEALKTIGGIGFSLLSPTEIRKYSVAEITQPETYDEDGMSVQGGLMDNRLGTLEPGQKCGTCGNTETRCPGHFGHVELAEPVLHIAFIDDINRLLQATCRACGRILLAQQELDVYRQRLTNITDYTPALKDEIAKEILAKAKKVKLCPQCGKQQYQIELTKPTTFHEITEEGGATRLLPVAIRERLERITNEDLELLGYNPKAARPEWFVLQVLPVPPLTVRPSITLESGIRSEDDLTHKIVDILRVNQRVREAKESGTPHLIVQDLVDLLHYHVTTYFDNEVSGIPQAHHRSGRPLKTLSQRLKGKEGRFRGSLSGKRVDFSSRTVISPDPSLDISDVGVPFEVAKKLTIPEKVSQWNLEFLKQLVIKGPFEHPGANYVIRPDGVKIRLDFASDRKALADSLVAGYIVERHLMEGDVVLFNRQPSLHRMSVMAHFVRVLPFRTFRLHPSVCPPYNADFDGDEMNLHVPQSEESRSEALMLMRVQDQISTPRYGGPIIGAIRDFLTAAYLLTKEDTTLTPEEFTNLAVIGGYTGDLPDPEKKGANPMYSGKQLFSLFLPKDLNFVLTSKWGKAKTGEANDVVIKDGVLVSGAIDKAAIGAEEPDSLLHRVAKDYGNDEARRFLNSILAVLKTFVTRRGFTYGFNELELPGEAKTKISDTLTEAYDNVTEHIKKYKAGTLALTRGLSPEDSLEFYIVNELSKARDRAGRTADRSFSPENSGVIMARTGARGSSLNLGQMTAALGQQSVRGKRVEKGMRGRSLSHFIWNDLAPEAKGFVKSNYRDGLNPTEFFFHAMGGREGLVDTAVRTQQSGYMQRRLVNAMEHLKVEYDLTVRDPGGNVIQFLYGEDGIDPAKSDHGKAVNLDRLIGAEQLRNRSRAKFGQEEAEKLLKKYQSRLNRRLYEELTEKLTEAQLTAEGAKNVLEKAMESIDYATVEPGEASGIVAAQSIGEPGTQMSLPHDERVIIREHGRAHAVRIGEFVDELMLTHSPTKEGETEWCDLPAHAEIEVPSLNPEGKVQWKSLRSASRHNHQRPLVRLRTRSGRRITATDNHSFVKRVNGHILPVIGRDLRLGDRIPVVKHLPLDYPVDQLHLGQFFSKQTHWFGSEMAKVRALGTDWHKGYGVLYQVPVEPDQLRNHLMGRGSYAIEDGSVYPYQNHSHSGLPETLQLDGRLGWLVGAYLSEGSAARYFVSLSNTEETFLAEARNIANQLRIGFSERDNHSGFGASHDLTLRSSLLSEFLVKTCGKLSEKHVPDFALGAGEEFLGMLLRAYFDGDGHVDVKRGAVRASSRSQELIDGIILLLTRLGIFASKTLDGKSFALWIPARFAPIFREKIGSNLDEKKRGLDLLCRLNANNHKKYTYDVLDMTSGFGNVMYDLARRLGIPTRRVNKFTKRQRIGRATLSRYIQLFDEKAGERGVDISAELRDLRTLLNEDVVWDEIVAIERVEPPKERVYDFSVPGLETFITAEGVVTHNTLRTFHFAGVKERDVTLGLPRLMELVDARKIPAKPSMDVYLDEGYRNSNEKALKVAKELLFTKVGNVVEYSEVDPTEGIKLHLNDAMVKDRDVTAEDVAEVVEAGKRNVQIERGRIIRVNLENADLSTLFTLRNKILNMKLKGIPGITRVTVVKEGEEWLIQTAGSNLAKVVMIPGVDSKRVVTNNVHEVAQVFGIEAARATLIREVMSTLDEQGLEVDIRHVFLVADLMTTKGYLQQIGRHGVAGTKSSVLARAAFEITVPTLAEAAVTGEVEELKGVTENVIVGLPIPVGTGMVGLYMG